MTTITLLDGGMGQELARRGGAVSDPLWSTRVLLEEPGLVTALHREYIDAGAEVITLAGYSATPERLAREGQPEHFEALQAAALACARRARDEAGREGVRIAGSLPPLVASYHPDTLPAAEKALASYRRLVACQAPGGAMGMAPGVAAGAGSGVDLFICETMASIAEARLAATAALESGLPVWVALTVDDDRSGRLRSGESLAEAVRELEPLGIAALLLNCSTPEAIDAAWPHLGGASVPIGAYANAFTSIAGLVPGGTVAALEARTDLGPAAYAACAARWIEGGATIVGGCCETVPAHVRALAESSGRPPA